MSGGVDLPFLLCRNVEAGAPRRMGEIIKDIESEVGPGADLEEAARPGAWCEILCSEGSEGWSRTDLEEARGPKVEKIQEQESTGARGSEEAPGPMRPTEGVRSTSLRQGDGASSIVSPWRGDQVGPLDLGKLGRSLNKANPLAQGTSQPSCKWVDQQPVVKLKEKIWNPVWGEQQKIQGQEKEFYNDIESE